MDFRDAVMSRYSCRAFLDKLVSSDTVDELVRLAQQAPSWGNTQPWKLYAAAGETAKAVRADMLAAYLNQREPCPDISMTLDFPDAMKSRYRDLGRRLFEIMGIGRGDKEARERHYANNYDAFKAPCLIYFTAPRGLNEYAVLDVGAFIALFCSAAADAGLATCILANLSRYPDLVRRRLPIPDDEIVVIGGVLGYADPDAPANRFRARRAPLEEALVKVGFE